MKGRKPQKNAIRRGRTPADVIELQAVSVAASIAKPDEVIANPDLDALWDTVVGDGARLNAVIADKRCKIAPDTVLIGSEKLPIVIGKGKSL